MKENDKLYSEDYESLDEKEKASIEDTIAVLKHEGYIDDGFLRDTLAKRKLGKISYEQAKKLALDKYGIKQ